MHGCPSCGGNEARVTLGFALTHSGQTICSVDPASGAMTFPEAGTRWAWLECVGCGWGKKLAPGVIERLLGEEPRP